MIVAGLGRQRSPSLAHAMRSKRNPVVDRVEIIPATERSDSIRSVYNDNIAGKRNALNKALRVVNFK